MKICKNVSLINLSCTQIHVYIIDYIMCIILHLPNMYMCTQCVCVCIATINYIFC